MKAARELWPLSAEDAGTTVTVNIAELKGAPIAEVLDSVRAETKQVFTLRRHNDLEGSVMRMPLADELWKAQA
eukprot:8933517-Heterocapsa_arctica.AAC.1